MQEKNEKKVLVLCTFFVYLLRNRGGMGADLTNSLLFTLYYLRKYLRHKICKVRINNRTHARYHSQIVGQRYNKKSRCASVAPANLRILKEMVCFFTNSINFRWLFV